MNPKKHLSDQLEKSMMETRLTGWQEDRSNWQTGRATKKSYPDSAPWWSSPETPGTQEGAKWKS